jgi:PAS domain S-box-containing protein
MKTPVKILVVDDDEDDFFIIKEYIKNIKDQEFIVDWCGKYKDAAGKICEGGYHLYFIDYLLGAKNGLDLIRESMANNCEEPFILLTGNGNRIIDLKAMEYGAVDYLVKTDLSTEKLERCIRYSLERALSLKALRNNERKFRNIFERSKDTVFIASEALVFVEVNNASFSLLEYERDEILSKSLYCLLASKQDEAVIRRELSSQGIVLDREIEILTKSGESKICILTLSKEVEIDGTIYIQGIMHEITALKKAEKVTLMLEKMNMASRLVRVMAHEVRNPLNNIMLSVEQLRPSLEDEERKIFIDIITRNSKRIGDLISDLLNSARPRDVSVQKKTLQAILDESIEAARDRIDLQNIELSRDYIDNLAWVMADNEKLKIAFLNIIINAVEAMEKDKGKLEVCVKNTKDHQYMVVIQDNGCGIKNEDIVRLFEPYFTTKQNGLGLGLASTLNILQSHNATFDVESKLNKGTAFKLFFNKA